MLTVKEIGKRIKDLRIKANQSQEYVAEQLNTSQNLISRLENGEGSLQLFLSVISYYRRLFNVDDFLAENFNVYEVEPARNMSGLESLAIEKLNLLKEEMTSEIDRVIALIEKP